MKKIIGYSHLLLTGVGVLVSGGLGLAFVVLAVWLAYADISAAGRFRLKYLMMPTMNILISSMLFYYCRELATRTKAVAQAVASRRYVAPHIRVTRYDLMAIIAFLGFVAGVCYLLGIW